MPLLRRAQSRLCGQHGTENGFSLIENVVAVVVFMIISAAVVALVVSGNNASAATRNRVSQTNVARSYLDLARLKPAAPPTTAYTTAPGSGATYTVSPSTRILPTPSATASTCPAGSLREVTVTVTGGGSSLTMATDLAC